MPLGYHQQISADVYQWFSCFVSHIWYSSWWCSIPGNSHYPRISGKWISYIGNSVIGNCKPLLHHFRSIYRRSPSILILVLIDKYFIKMVATACLLPTVISLLSLCWNTDRPHTYNPPSLHFCGDPAFYLRSVSNDFHCLFFSFQEAPRAF